MLSREQLVFGITTRFDEITIFFIFKYCDPKLMYTILHYWSDTKDHGQFEVNLWRMRTVWGTSTGQFRRWQCPLRIGILYLPLLSWKDCNANMAHTWTSTPRNSMPDTFSVIILTLSVLIIQISISPFKNLSLLSRTFSHHSRTFPHHPEQSRTFIFKIAVCL